MCGQMNRCRRGGRTARQSVECGGSSCCCQSSCCCCEREWDRGCCCNETATSPTATIAMDDYQHFILVPTTVFDQGDVDCGCATGRDW